MSAKEEADLEELLGASELGIGDVAEFEVGGSRQGADDEAVVCGTERKGTTRCGNC